ncbi:hypothetical protein EUGRSUZ_B00675 [Eucalyptus grandis]|uniref:Uncharacterized protein n=2 Tax=Eucalyptus grandis TaxID=71139 RepID=A0ACC3LNM9_EUCGR|nr:hypothetical protein EUGRSUZ_B00675 [Eucalyptus grandis]
MLNDIQSFVCTTRKRGWRRPWEERERGCSLEDRGKHGGVESRSAWRRRPFLCEGIVFFWEGFLVLVQREATFDHRRIPFSLKGLADLERRRNFITRVHRRSFRSRVKPQTILRSFGIEYRAKAVVVHHWQK